MFLRLQMNPISNAGSTNPTPVTPSVVCPIRLDLNVGPHVGLYAAAIGEGHSIRFAGNELYALSGDVSISLCEENSAARQGAYLGLIFQDPDNLIARLGYSRNEAFNSRLSWNFRMGLLGGQIQLEGQEARYFSLDFGAGLELSLLRNLALYLQVNSAAPLSAMFGGGMGLNLSAESGLKIMLPLR